MTEKMDMTDDYLYVKVTEREPFRQKGKKGVAAPKLNKKLNQQSAKNYQVQKSRKPKTPNAINMLMFKNIILSIHFHNFNSMIPAMFRLTYKHPDNNSSTASHPAWVIYSVLDEIVDVYTSHVDKAEESIKILDEAIDTIEIQEHPLFLARVGLFLLLPLKKPFFFFLILIIGMGLLGKNKKNSANEGGCGELGVRVVSEERALGASQVEFSSLCLWCLS